MPTLDLTDPTPLQKIMFRQYKSGNYREISVTGVVRQGKTAEMVHCLVDQIAINLDKRPNDPLFNQYGALGESILALKRNLSEYFQDCCHWYGLSFKEIGGNHPHWLIGGKAKVFMFGGSTQTSYRHIRGVTLFAGIVDEITLVHPTAFETFEERLSFDGGWIMVTANPDRPTHWYRQRCVNASIGQRIKVINVKKNTNQHYSKEAWEALLARNPASTAYRRNVLGEWVSDHGAVFPLEARHFTDMPLPSMTGIAVVDEGLRGIQAALLYVPLSRTHWLVAGEYYHDSQEEGIQTSEWHVRKIMEGKDGNGWSVLKWLCDPAAGNFKDAARKIGGAPVVNAKPKDFLRSVDRTNNALFDGRLLIHDSLVKLPANCDAYVWSESSDAPIKDHKNDHLPDCFRYGGNHVFPYGGIFG